MCVLITSELGIPWRDVVNADYGLLVMWAREVMAKWIRRGDDEERLRMYFEELVEGADYSSTWAALRIADKTKSAKGRL